MKIPHVLEVQSEHKPGSLGRILTVFGELGIVVEGLVAVGRDHRHTTWEVTIETEEGERVDTLLRRLDELSNARVKGLSDRVFDRHRGGKIEMVSRKPIDSLNHLRDVYTPGVARVCLTLRDDPALAREYTAKGRNCAIVTNGTRVLGLGDIGCVASLPVMEGKAALMHQLAGVSGIPILVDTKDPDELIETVVRIAPGFGAIQLEDISTPSCFRIEDELKRRLPIPVMHDDQHGTAVVTLAAILSATHSLGVELRDCVVGQIGLGAAGLGICALIRKHGVKQVLGADLDEEARERLSRIGGEPVELGELLRRADIVVATTGVKGLIQPSMVREGQMILALSNPEPEIEPADALAAGARFATDGKVVNNVLGYPGIFRGALDAGASAVTDNMLLAAARTISELGDEISLVPDPLDREVHRRVAAAVAEAAIADGVARPA